MTLLLHIIIALSSVALTTITFIAPSRAKLRISYGLIGATLVSGAYLVLTSSAHMLQACVTGLLYVAFMTVGVIAARRKLVLRTK
jgi:hypothetical protein